MEPKLLIVGFTNIDVNIVPQKEQTVLPGGAGYFVALAASSVTKPIGFVTRIGYDFDPTYLLTQVLPEGVHIIPDKKTSRSIQTYVSENDLSKRDITLEWGVALDLCPEDIPKDWVHNVAYVHVATMPPKQQEIFVHFVKTYMPQARLSIDTDQCWLKNTKDIRVVERMFRKSDILFVNRIEYQLLKAMVDEHPCAIVKSDCDGAACLKKGKAIAKVKAPSVVPVNATGAGDTLAGVFLGHLAEDRDIQESLEDAVKKASLSIAK